MDRIDPKTNKVSKSIELKVPGAEGAIAFGEGSIWVSMPGFPLTRIDPVAEAVAQQFFGDGGGSVRVSAGAVWLSNKEAGTLLRIDPKLVVLTLADSRLRLARKALQPPKLVMSRAPASA